MHIFTSITANYLPKAAALARPVENPSDYLHEGLGNIAHCRELREGVEPAVVGDVLRRPDEPAPGGAGKRSADADPFDAEILELPLREPWRSRKHIDRQLSGDADDL